MTPTAEGNFAGRLRQRLGPHSYLIDAAARRKICPEDLSAQIAAYAASLRSAGLGEGDRILIGCSLSLPTAFVYLGAIYAGLVAVPVDDRTLRESTAVLLQTTGAKAVWTETGLGGGKNLDRSVRSLEGDLAAGRETAKRMIEPAARSDSDLAALMATSGSTGAPRFVMVTHGNLIANTEAIIRSQRLESDDRAMLILPLSYCFGASVLHTHLYRGGGAVLDRRFMFPDKVLGAMAQFDCTTFAGVPTAFHVLLRRSNIRQIALPSLRRFLQAGGALPFDSIREMRESFPKVHFYVMYGQTEATARISCMEPERSEQKPGSVGRPLDNLTVRIVDEEGKDLPAGRRGELLVKGPSVCAGYLNDSEKTRDTFVDGWLRTRDLARQDEEGYLWIEGRKESFVKMRGIRVSFPEIEAKVLEIPGVYECVARALTHPEAGEALVLFIVPEQGVNIGIEEVRRHLPAHWAIDSVRVVAELPKTSAGKIAFSSLPL